MLLLYDYLHILRLRLSQLGTKTVPRKSKTSLLAPSESKQTRYVENVQNIAQNSTIYSRLAVTFFRNMNNDDMNLTSAENSCNLTRIDELGQIER